MPTADRPVWACIGIAFSSPVGPGDPFGYGIPPFHRIAIDVISVKNGDLQAGIIIGLLCHALGSTGRDLATIEWENVGDHLKPCFSSLASCPLCAGKGRRGSRTLHYGRGRPRVQPRIFSPPITRVSDPSSPDSLPFCPGSTALRHQSRLSHRFHQTVSFVPLTGMMSEIHFSPVPFAFSLPFDFYLLSLGRVVTASAPPVPGVSSICLIIYGQARQLGSSGYSNFPMTLHLSTSIVRFVITHATTFILILRHVPGRTIISEETR